MKFVVASFVEVNAAAVAGFAQDLSLHNGTGHVEGKQSTEYCTMYWTVLEVNGEFGWREILATEVDRQAVGNLPTDNMPAVVDRNRVESDPAEDSRTVEHVWKGPDMSPLADLSGTMNIIVTSSSHAAAHIPDFAPPHRYHRPDREPLTGWLTASDSSVDRCYLDLAGASVNEESFRHS